MRVFPCWLLLAMGCGVPPGPEPSDEPFAQTATLALPAIDVQPGEISLLCQSVTLGNDTPWFVGSVAMEAGPGWHHSNWIYVPEDDFAGPDGTWPCAERNFETVSAALRGGVLFAQSTGVTRETQQFPAGAALVLPPRVKVIGEVHLLNATDAVAPTSITLTLERLRESEVATRLAPLALAYFPLSLAPEAQSEFEMACDFKTLMGGPLDFRIYYALPHYHALGEGMTVSAYGGAGGDRLIYETEGALGESLGAMLPTPFDLADATGIRVSCRYDNPGPNRVSYGLDAADEMCIFLAFTDSTLKWAGGVTPEATTQSLGKVDGRDRHQGPCALFAFGAD